MKKTPVFLLFLWSFSSVLYGQERYVNEKYGFSIEKPKDWLILTHPDLSKDLNKGHGPTLITFYKYDPLSFKGVSPTIFIFVEANTHKTYDKFCKEYSKKTQNTFLLEYTNDKPTIVEINGNKGVFLKSNYLVINEYDKHLLVHKKSYVFYTKKLLYFLNLYMDQGDSSFDKLFGDLIQSIKIAND